jgi:hypothetical protein
VSRSFAVWCWRFATVSTAFEFVCHIAYCMASIGHPSGCLGQQMPALGLHWPTLQLVLASIGRYPVTRGLGKDGLPACGDQVQCGVFPNVHWSRAMQERTVHEYTPAISSPSNPCKPHSAPPRETASTGLALSAVRAPSMKVGAGDRHWNLTQQLQVTGAWSHSPIVSQYGWFIKRPRGGKR